MARARARGGKLCTNVRPVHCGVLVLYHKTEVPPLPPRTPDLPALVCMTLQEGNAGRCASRGSVGRMAGAEVLRTVQRVQGLR